MKLESPIEFDTEKELENVKVKYIDLMEIAQGGPEVGRLSINGEEICSYEFGGPCILTDIHIVVPVYKKRFFDSGFKIGLVNVKTREVQTYGKQHNLIYLDKFKDGKVFFYKDLNRGKLKVQELFTLITVEKIREFDQYHGFYLQKVKSNTNCSSEEEWSLMDELLQDIKLVKRGLASQAFSEKLDKRLRENFEGEEAIDLFKAIADKNW